MTAKKPKFNINCWQNIVVFFFFARIQAPVPHGQSPWTAGGLHGCLVSLPHCSRSEPYVGTIVEKFAPKRWANFVVRIKWPFMGSEKATDGADGAFSYWSSMVMA